MVSIGQRSGWDTVGREEEEEGGEGGRRTVDLLDHGLNELLALPQLRIRDVLELVAIAVRLYYIVL